MEAIELVKEFGDLINIGGVTKVVTMGNHKIKLRTLTYDEQTGVLEGIPADLKDSKRLDTIQKELLAAAIEDIDGKKLAKDELRYLLGNGQAAFCNSLFGEYEILLGEQAKSLEDVKKNSSIALKKTP